MRNCMPTIVALLAVMASYASAGTSRIGAAAPALTVTEWLAGEPVALVGEKNPHTTVIVFFTTQGRACVDALPDLATLHARYRGESLKIIGFSAKADKNTAAEVRAFLRKHSNHVPYAVAFEEGNATCEAYGLPKDPGVLPWAVVVTPDGRIAWTGHPADGMSAVADQVVRGEFDLVRARQVEEVKGAINEASSYEEMLPLFDRWASLVPKDPMPLVVKMQVQLFDLNDAKNALQTARQAVVVAHRNGAESLLEVAYWLTDASANPEFEKLASVAIRDAAKAAPDDPALAVRRVELQTMLGHASEALALAERTAPQVADKAEFLHRLAYAIASQYREGRHNVLAMDLVNQALALRPGHADDLDLKFFVAAYCLKQTKDLEPLGNQVIAAAAEDADFLDDFAWRILQQLETEPVESANAVALAAAQAANRLTKFSNWAHLDTLALAQFATGDAAGAAQIERRAVELCDDPVAKRELEARLQRFASDKSRGKTARPRGTTDLVPRRSEK